MQRWHSLTRAWLDFPTLPWPHIERQGLTMEGAHWVSQLFVTSEEGEPVPEWSHGAAGRLHSWNLYLRTSRKGVTRLTSPFFAELLERMRASLGHRDAQDSAKTSAMVSSPLSTACWNLPSQRFVWLLLWRDFPLQTCLIKKKQKQKKPSQAELEFLAANGIYPPGKEK